MSKFFKRLRPRHWAWASVLVCAGIWWPTYILVSPPPFLKGNVDPVILSICMVIAIFGAALEIFGYLASQQPGRLGVLGVSVELIGLILASVGPVAYLVSYSYLLWQGSGDVNFGSAFILAVTITVLYSYRAVIVVPRFRSEAHDPAKR